MSPAMPDAGFHMADVGDKRPTRRRAIATGWLYAGPVAYPRIVERSLPKGDALVMAEIAGLQGAKLASTLMPLCHPLPLDAVRVEHMVLPERHAVRIYCEVKTMARTGVEMEALAGVNAALLTLYDLTKPVEPALSIGGVRLLFKEGGKSGLWLHPEGMSSEETQRFRPRAPSRLEGVACAVLTLSDRAEAGVYEDRSGPVVIDYLRGLGARIAVAEVLADDIAPLATRLRDLAAAGIRLCVCTGGTGLGPRDLAPEALLKAADRRVTGLAELFRSQSHYHTPMAWLSRAEAVQVGAMLAVALPGSPRAAAQGMAIIAPLLAHALAMIDQEAHS